MACKSRLAVSAVTAEPARATSYGALDDFTLLLADGEFASVVGLSFCGDRPHTAFCFIFALDGKIYALFLRLTPKIKTCFFFGTNLRSGGNHHFADERIVPAGFLSLDQYDGASWRSDPHVWCRSRRRSWRHSRRLSVQDWELGAPVRQIAPLQHRRGITWRGRTDRGSKGGRRQAAGPWRASGHWLSVTAQRINAFFVRDALECLRLAS